MKNSLIERMGRLCHPLAPSESAATPILHRLSGLRAVLFDVYGTLLTCGQGEVGSAGPTPGAAAVAAMREAGLHVDDSAADRTADLLAHEISAEHARLKTEGREYPEVDIREIWRGVLAVLHSEGALSDEIDPATPDRLAVAYECRVNPAWPMPGLGEMLDRLETAGLRMGIVSNAQFYTPLLLELFNETGWQRGRFERELCSWSFELREGKPSPALIARSLSVLARRHGIQPEQTVYVGNDMLNDIAPAARAGCRTALFAGDARSLRWRYDDPRVQGLRPDLVITRLPQLAECIV